MVTAISEKVVDRRKVVRQALQFPAHEVPKTVRPSSVQNFFRGITAGMDSAYALLQARASVCRDERLVLVGYSQGAMALHRVVIDLVSNKQDAILKRLDGVVLIADGDRLRNDNHTRYGSAGEVYGGVGHGYRFVSNSRAAKFPVGMKSRVHSLCNARDAVCDTSGVFNITGFGTHSGYTSTPLTAAASTAVAKRILSQPVPPVPPPLDVVTTYVQTTGGITSTWSDHRNAGGVRGPSIPKQHSVQVACKLQGFPVANGNPWWYRIASSPWNGEYYASADAFYNNGSTSGSLLGTPYVDTAVADCR